jgi:hypothetical protein
MSMELTLVKVDVERRCSKCGGKALARWHPAKQDRVRGNFYFHGDECPDEEFMERICQTCGYTWLEACL